MSELLKQIAENLYAGKAEEVARLTRQALEQELTPAEILRAGLINGMDAVGRDFKQNVLYVPEVLIAARAMHRAMDILKPLLTEGDVPLAGRMVIGTVQGDLHNIGKNLVIMMMEGAGFEVHDLGIDVAPEKFVEAVREKKPGLVGMSALLTTTMAAMRTTIVAIEKAGLRKEIKIMVGGAPVTAGFAEAIGADSYAPDAASAVDRAKELLAMA